MTITPNLVRATIVAPGTQSIWTDNTVYGGSAPNRNTVALYLTAFKVDENQVATPVLVNTFDPETVTTFTTSQTTFTDSFGNVSIIDGWYRYFFVIVPYWLIGTTYNQYDVVWDHATTAFYEYINPTPSAGNAVTNTTFFSPLPDPTLVLANVGTATQTNNIAYQVINKIVDFQTSICFNKAASKHAKEYCDGIECGCDSRTGKNLHVIRDLFSVLSLNEASGLFIEGERNARLAQKYCDDCGCLTR